MHVRDAQLGGCSLHNPLLQRWMQLDFFIECLYTVVGYTTVIQRVRIKPPYT